MNYEKKYSYCKVNRNQAVSYYEVHTLQVTKPNLPNSKHSLVNNFSNAQGGLNTRI